MKRALNLGCGTKKVEIEGYNVFHIDIRPEVKPEMVRDARHLAFEPESVDLIYSSHLLEHMSRGELPVVIEHWRSILKLDGVLITIVPDLSVAVDEIVKGTAFHATWDIIYGAQMYAYDYHKTGFTSSALRALLEMHGFVIEKIETKSREIHCAARRGK